MRQEIIARHRVGLALTSEPRRRRALLVERRAQAGDALRRRRRLGVGGSAMTARNPELGKSRKVTLKS